MMIISLCTNSSPNSESSCNVIRHYYELLKTLGATQRMPEKRQRDGPIQGGCTKYPIKTTSVNN